LIDQYWPQRPLGTHWYAIGTQTANTLLHYDIDVKTPSEGLDSEALMSLHDLHSVRQQKVLIIKGKGGRTLIAETLKARGAKVKQLDSYERTSPDYTTNPLPDVLRNKKINAILCASGETVTHLLQWLPESNMPHLHLVVPSQRIARAFSSQPFRQIVVSEGAGNKAMLAALEVIEDQLVRSGQINKHSEELS
ncbi:uroporphyrinogen-III synthase, partial [Endozoicomonas sp.]|nr:uroporphyrinogen-III synthase [Endozoicomonas sp.]